MKRKRRPSIFDLFERMLREMEREMMEFMTLTEDWMEELKKRPGVKYYGVSVTFDDKGRPIIREFGNMKPPEGLQAEEAQEEADVREPLIEVVKEGDKVRVTAEIPGVEKKDIKVKIIGDNILEIKAEGKDGRKYYKRVKLPAVVDLERAKSTYVNGILNVELPIVKELPKEGKEIPVE